MFLFLTFSKKEEQVVLNRVPRLLPLPVSPPSSTSTSLLPENECQHNNKQDSFISVKAAIK